MTARHADPRHIDAADVAKLIRAELKLNFPGVVFKVKTNKYAGGASVDVAWTDGPTPGMIEHFTAKYEGKQLSDRPDDSYIYPVGDLDGEPVRCGSDSVHLNRRDSMHALEAAAAKVLAKHGIAMTFQETRYGGIEWFGGDLWQQTDEIGYSGNALMRAELGRRAVVPAGAVWGVGAKAPAPVVGEPGDELAARRAARAARQGEVSR